MSEKHSVWHDTWYIVAVWVGLMSGLTAIFREWIEVFLPEIQRSALFNACAVTCFVLSCGFLVWKQRRIMREMERKMDRPDIRGEISDLRALAPDNYPYDGPVNSTNLCFTLTVCNHSPARTNIIRVLLTVADVNGQRHKAEASVSRPTGTYRTEYKDRTRPITAKISSVVLEHRITERFSGEAHFPELSPNDINLDSLEAIAYDSTGEYRLSRL